MAAAAFSCCAIERTRTDDDEREEEERAKDDDEIIVADVGDDFARPRQSPGEAREAPRRGAGANAEVGTREDARERDAVVIVGEAGAMVKRKKKNG